jgi:tetratricopeptide (TPR) repeat protein
MITTNRDGSGMRYRLLSTTRDYVLEREIDEAEFTGVATRHAIYYRRWLEQSDLHTLSSASERMFFLADIGNVRVALGWCFGPNGNVDLGVGLAAVAAPVFLAMSLLAECYRWSEQALNALGDLAPDSPKKMHLQAAFGLSSMFTHGNSEAARIALNGSLAIAEASGDGLNQLRVLGPLHTFHVRIGDFRVALHYAERAANVAKAVADQAALAYGSSLFAIALHRIGDFRRARLELEAMRRNGPTQQRSNTPYLGFDGYTVAGAHLARTLWLLGLPAQAADLARQAVKEAVALGHPVTLSVVLIRAMAVFRARVDLDSFEEYIKWFISHAQSQSLGPYVSLGHGFRGQLAILRGQAENGLKSLEFCLAEHRTKRHMLRDTVLKISLAQGLSTVGRHTESLAVIDDSVRLANENGDLSYFAEWLRVKGNVLLALPQPRREEAEECFLRSLEASRHQGARAWELRSAIDLAKLWSDRGRTNDARALLQPVHAQFTEGFDTADLKAAERLLTQLA